MRRGRGLFFPWRPRTLAATVYGDAVGVLDGIDDVEPTTVDVCYEASLAPPVSRLPAS